MDDINVTDRFASAYANKKRVTKGDFDEGMTDKSQARDCCVHRILKRYETGNILTHVNQKAAFYDDVSDIPDYHEGMNRITAVNSAFEGLPSAIRRRFQNDPSQFVEFMAKIEDNYEEAVKLGLIEPKQAPLSDGDNTSPKVNEASVEPTNSSEEAK